MPSTFSDMYRQATTQLEKTRRYFLSMSAATKIAAENFHGRLRLVQSAGIESRGDVQATDDGQNSALGFIVMGSHGRTSESMNR